MRASPADEDLTAAQRRAVTELLRISPLADELGRRFAEAGHEIHLVGGSVRDALLGRLGDDLDFATDAHPDQTLALVQGWAEAIWEIGREFGTIGAQRRGIRLEITTYRADAYDGVSRNPVVRYGTSLLDDLRRRDFTINAMAVSLPEHTFVDPYGGLRTWPRGCCARRARRRVLRRRPAADDAGGPVRRPAAVRAGARGPRGDDGGWPETCERSPRSGSGTSS